MVRGTRAASAQSPSRSIPAGKNRTTGPIGPAARRTKTAVTPETRASTPALLMAETIHREIESLDAARWGAIVVTNKLLEERRSRVRSKYHLSARTGHHTLSYEIAE